MHLNSLLLFKKYGVEHFKDAKKVLEVGAAGFPSEYAKCVDHTSMEWHTLDIGDGFNNAGDRNPLHILSPDEYNYPIEDERFDIVLAGNVIEHVKDIWKWMDELTRITRRGGKIIIICPISWTFHEAPVDCWRIYPDGMISLMSKSGLNVIMSTCESLEANYLPGYYPVLPGVSTLPPWGDVSTVLKVKGFYNLILSKIPLLKKLTIPVTVAYDTIAVARK